ncbi:helix-turn-helix domain-containing protein [Bordetella genomosp. 13]|uniref:HTH cro/C1-type domain-containing protein n=1 Tax=Bordetella genomosp. 13 TaxID=463040 RepID=A0A1W6ZER1_9BORD|nr:helix-turn-helix transcriptional regulator [Bordetella genomosp. 13]ARP95364.1 hypothetical protein CAL15_13795 [Bordetella genomosp. 13]
MNTIPSLSAQLKARLASQGWTQATLREAAGVSQRTLTNVLSGEQDFKISTLLALADRMGLDVVLVPKGARAALDEGGAATPARIPTRVQRALRRLRGADDDQEPR